MVYGYAVVTDRITVASKSLRGGFFLTSNNLLVFASNSTQTEYRDKIRHQVGENRGVLPVNILDFNFEPYKKFLKQQEEARTIGRFQNGGGGYVRTHVQLKFSKQFDGTPDRALRWTRWAQKLYTKHSTHMRLEYKIVTSENSPSMGKFKSTLRFDQIPDLPEGSEWRKILRALQIQFCPTYIYHRTHDEEDEGEGEEDGRDHGNSKGDDDGGGTGDEDGNVDGRVVDARLDSIEEGRDYGDSERENKRDDDGDVDSEAYTETEDEADEPSGEDGAGEQDDDEAGGQEDDEETAEEEDLPQEIREPEDLAVWGGDGFVKGLLGGEYSIRYRYSAR